MQAYTGCTSMHAHIEKLFNIWPLGFYVTTQGCALLATLAPIKAHEITHRRYHHTFAHLLYFSGALPARSGPVLARHACIAFIILKPFANGKLFPHGRSVFVTTQECALWRPSLQSKLTITHARSQYRRTLLWGNYCLVRVLC